MTIILVYFKMSSEAMLANTKCFPNLISGVRDKASFGSHIIGRKPL